MSGSGPRLRLGAGLMIDEAGGRVIDHDDR